MGAWEPSLPRSYTRDSQSTQSQGTLTHITHPSHTHQHTCTSHIQHMCTKLTPSLIPRLFLIEEISLGTRLPHPPHFFLSSKYYKEWQNRGDLAAHINLVPSPFAFFFGDYSASVCANWRAKYGGEGSLVTSTHTHTGGMCYGGLMFVWVYRFSWQQGLVHVTLDKETSFWGNWK